MKKAQLATPTAGSPVLQIQQEDYVNAVVLDETGQALVFECPRPNGRGVYWHVLHYQLPHNADPFTAVQTALLHKTGHQTSHWAYLGSHVMSIEQPSGNGYFFCAQQARQTTTPQPNGHSPAAAKWVPLTDLRYALLDGRIAITSHALTVSLALLTLRQ
ncbi:MAG: hypothetical protein R3D55_19975 [Chloroflexota bacterium]